MKSHLRGERRRGKIPCGHDLGEYSPESRTPIGGFDVYSVIDHQLFQKFPSPQQIHWHITSAPPTAAHPAHSDFEWLVYPSPRKPHAPRGQIAEADIPSPWAIECGMGRGMRGCSVPNVPDRRKRHTHDKLSTICIREWTKERCLDGPVYKVKDLAVVPAVQKPHPLYIQAERETIT